MRGQYTERWPAAIAFLVMDFPYNSGVGMRLALDARKLTDYGIGTYLSHLLAGLAGRSEVQLIVVVRPGHEERVSALAPDARLLTVSARGYGITEHVKVPAALWRERPDLVHVPHYVVPAALPGPVVVTVHDIIQLFYPPRSRPTLATMYLRVVLRSALRRARRVITVSRTSRRDLIKLFGADPRRLDVVANGVDNEFARRPGEELVEQIKEKYRLRPPLVLVVANDKPHKNLDVVLRSYHRAMQSHGIPGQLVLVGGVGADHPLALRALRLGLDDHVRCLGRIPQSHLHALYHLSSVLLHVALYEGFGLPILEAMRAGLPVVTSNLGAMRELGEGAARLVNPLDVIEVASAVQRVLVDDPLRRRMVEAGLRRADALTWSRTVDGTLDAYRVALGEEMQ
jgi:glycosyltransferase involved in cell wall biosynthesis